MKASETINLACQLDAIICGDSLAEMRKFPDGAFDLIVTSPPYNLKNSTGNGVKAVCHGFTTIDFTGFGTHWRA